MLNNVIKCDACNSIILPNQINIYDKTIKPGIQARMWDCPKCNKSHLIIVTDKTSRRKMEENRKDRIKIGNLNKRYMALSKAGKPAEHLLKQTDKLWKRIESRTEELDERSKKLIKEYEALT